MVSTTGSGLEALSMIKASKPDIVLLDIFLNDLGGIEVLKKLREYDKETKVVVITGQLYSQREIQEILKLGVSGYENKPLILERLGQLISHILGDKLLCQLNNPKKKTLKVEKTSGSAIVHQLSNLLGIIRSQCENFTLNLEDGIYADKSSEELVKMSVEIMQGVEQTVDRAMNVVEQIKKNEF